MNPLYNIWNYDYILQQAQMEHHFSQVKQIQDAAKALHDFLDCCDKIEPAYQTDAIKQFSIIIAPYFAKYIYPGVSRWDGGTLRRKSFAPLPHKP